VTLGDLGLNSDLRVGKKKLHIQTSFNTETRVAIAEIFEGGRIVDRRETVFDTDISENRFQKEVKQFHGLVISDLELLFFVARQVRASKSISSITKLGKLFLQKGFYEEAIEQFLLVQKLEANASCCYNELGKAYFASGDYTAAMESFLLAIDMNPNYPDLYLNLAKVYWKLEKYSLAIVQLNKAIKLNKEYHIAYYTLGLYLAESTITSPRDKDLLPPIERLKEAEHYLRQAVNLSADYDKQLIESGFEKLTKRENIEAAITNFEDALQKTVTQSSKIVADSEFYLKFLFAGLDKDTKALDHYIRTLERSIAQHSGYPDLHQSLGIAYLIKGWHLFVNSMDEFREAVELNPSFKKAQKNLKLLENDGRGFLILLRAILK